MTKRSPFKYFKTSPEIIRLTAMLYVRFPLSLRNVEDLLHERGIYVSHETIRFWWNRFGPMFASEIRRRRVQPTASKPNDAQSTTKCHIFARPKVVRSGRAVILSGETNLDLQIIR